MNKRMVEILLQEFDAENEIHAEVLCRGLRALPTPNQDEIGVNSAFKEVSEASSLLRVSIKNMSYETFLKSLYWGYVSSKVKSFYKKCQLCSSVDNLAVHHNTYENHGREHEERIQQKDLVCLCASCHKLFHKNQENGVRELKKEVFELNSDSVELIDFETFWKMYRDTDGRKSNGKKIAKQRFERLRDSNDKAFRDMLAFLPYYLDGNRMYRMDASGFIMFFAGGKLTKELKLCGSIYSYSDGVLYIK